MAQISFKPLTSAPGFYPVVPDTQWVQKMLRWGVKTIQLRFKAGADGDAAIGSQVQEAVAAGRAYPGAQVFINDHWQHAIAAGAYGVHLGQEDWAALGDSDRDALRASGLRLGISTHTPEELAIARAAQPSYLAIGPIYPTTLKVMPYSPVGLEQLAAWVGLADQCPVVAIGGITLAALPGVMACGVSGAAVVSAVTQAADPQAAAQEGLRLCAGFR